MLSEPIAIFRLPRWLSGKESACQRKRPGFNPWVRKIPRRKKWQPTPAFLSGKSHGQRNLVGYNPYNHKELDTTEHSWMNHSYYLSLAFGSVVKIPPASARDMSLIPEW